MSAFSNLLDMQPEKLEGFEDELKLITPNLKVYLYRIDYSYETVRNNHKKNHKILILNELDSTEAKYRFVEYMNKFNKDNPHRKISNVEILDIKSRELDLKLL